MREDVNRTTYMFVAIHVAYLLIIAHLVLFQVHGIVKNLLAVNVGVSDCGKLTKKSNALVSTRKNLSKMNYMMVI